ncbi:type II toxin-antitoxin system PemK/MazF family toxin [Pandoraea sputorum]|uniref:Growth inhibitor PemK n=1 Tax=Pandoraea sputorum TaxID=93222 RepID=A0A5E5BK96_9BURK|nr:type II toxin-antitoxin system PemK/MazF family toxin [Pandoraea sputorum]VVE85717.1 growth inhibitor PemK [Pandoraea sputorum]
MMRGAFVTLAMRAGFGKPRPAWVIQANPWGEPTSVTVLPIPRTRVAAPLLRVLIPPGAENGLPPPSHVMMHETMTVIREKLGSAFGRIDADARGEVER